MLALCIGRNILLEKRSQVNIGRRIRDADLVQDSLFVFIDESTESAFSNHNDTVTLLLAPFDDRLVHTVFAVDLECKLWHHTYVDVAACQARGQSKVAALLAHQTDDAHTVLGSLSLDVRSRDEGYCLSHCRLKAESLVNKRKLVHDRRRHVDDLTFELTLSNDIDKVKKLGRPSRVTNQIQLCDSLGSEVVRDFLWVKR